MRVPDAGKDSIKLSELSVNVSVVGNVATTTCDMIFTNSSSRVLEGEFEFPLGQGQTIVGYALDINGKMRQGVSVEKEKARTVFEDIERRNVDPGLVELTAGNNFKTRVYPLPAHGSRHVQISYEETVKSDQNGRSYILSSRSATQSWTHFPLKSQCTAWTRLLSRRQKRAVLIIQP